MKTIQEMAEEATRVQDACNIAGIAGLLQRTHAELSRRFGTEYANNHPITIAIVEKLITLTGNNGEMKGQHWRELDKLAAGEVPAVMAMEEACEQETS